MSPLDSMYHPYGCSGGFWPSADRKHLTTNLSDEGTDYEKYCQILWVARDHPALVSMPSVNITLAMTSFGNSESLRRPRRRWADWHSLKTIAGQAFPEPLPLVRRGLGRTVANVLSTGLVGHRRPYPGPDIWWLILLTIVPGRFWLSVAGVGKGSGWLVF